MRDLLAENPLLLLFTVAGLGYVVGRLRVRGFGLGVAAVLFAGLAVGAIDPRLALPEIVSQFGLVLFVYTVGLTAGPGFFAAMRRRGLRDTGFALGVLLLSAGAAWGAGRLLGLPAPVLAGLFTGTLTNTPALAAVLETVKARGGGAEALALPAVGYSVAYPVGVVIVLFSMWVFPGVWGEDRGRGMVRGDRRSRLAQHGPPAGPAPGLEHGLDNGADQRGGDDRAEASGAAAGGGAGPSASAAQAVTNRDIRITRPDVTGIPVAQLWRSRHLEHQGRPPAAVVSRLKRGDRQVIVTADTRFAVGDVITLVAPRAELDRLTPLLGEPSQERPELDRSQLDFRRIFVSNREVAGRRLRELDLQHRFGATVTRVKRGDVDLVASADIVLELGDRVRVVAPRDRLEAVARFLGDSFRQLSEVDIPSISLGIALGLLIGLVPIPLPGGLALRLGFAGGPLLVALVLGTLGRSGPVVWIQPHNANLTLRQLGLVLFLAGVGTRSGYALGSTLQQAGAGILVAATLVAAVFSLVTLVVGYRMLHIPMAVLAGMLAGLQTQPAALAFAEEQAQDEQPGVGYAAVYPTAMVAKILLAQLLLMP